MGKIQRDRFKYGMVKLGWEKDTLGEKGGISHPFHPRSILDVDQYNPVVVICVFW